MLTQRDKWEGVISVRTFKCMNVTENHKVDIQLRKCGKRISVEDKLWS